MTTPATSVAPNDITSDLYAMSRGDQTALTDAVVSLEARQDVVATLDEVLLR